VQEASSMVVGGIVKELLSALPAEAVVLDLCAAPGGKSTHVASVLRDGDLLVANEVIGTRTPILAENLCKWGAANHIITKADASRFGKSDAQFNIVVADLPCSGEGMFRKDPAAINEWSENNVKLCAERQQRIVTDIWPAIAPGGYLIYSTCTFNSAEMRRM
jgi:16S rRNA C967 or C1407 C5-methylase (RsmB/RsmF family)